MMSDLLTKGEYEAIAKGLELPQNAFIDGGYRPAISGKTFDTLNPVTGAVLGKVAACDAADVDFAVSKAREAFDDGRWVNMHPSDRKGVLIRFAKLLTRNARELAVMESVDSGKTIYDCETVDIPETIDCIMWHAEAIDRCMIKWRHRPMIIWRWLCAKRLVLLGWCCRGISHC